MDRPYYLALLAEARPLAGDVGRALAAVEMGLEEAEALGRHFFAAELERLKGDLLALTGARSGVVEAQFERALEHARAQKARALELRAAVSLARLSSHDGEPERGAALVRPILATSTRVSRQPTLSRPLRSCTHRATERQRLDARAQSRGYEGRACR